MRRRPDLLGALKRELSAEVGEDLGENGRRVYNKKARTTTLKLIGKRIGYSRVIGPVEAKTRASCRLNGEAWQGGSAMRYLMKCLICEGQYVTWARQLKFNKPDQCCPQCAKRRASGLRGDRGQHKRNLARLLAPGLQI